MHSGGIDDVQEQKDQWQQQQQQQQQQQPGSRQVEASLPEICFDFTKGLCTRGDKCKFTHDISTIVNFNSKEKGGCGGVWEGAGCRQWRTSRSLA